MKNIVLKFTLSLCLLSSTYAKREIIKVTNLNITTNKTDGTTHGRISANNMNIDFGGKVFEANDAPNKLSGTVQIKDHELKANVSFATFTTTLAPDNPLATLDHFLLKDTQINFDKEEMFFETPSVKIGTNDTTVSATELKGSCDPKGDPTTDIDIVCLNNGNLVTQQAQIINDTVNILTNNLQATITPEDIVLTATENIFTSNEEKTLVNKLNVNCKNAIKTRFSIDDFIDGCLEEGHLLLDEFSQFKPPVKMQTENKNFVGLQDIKFIKIDLNQKDFNIVSKIKVLFYVNLKINGKMEHLKEENTLKVSVERATMVGIPAKTLTLMLLSLFLDEDAIKIEGDIIYIAL